LKISHSNDFNTDFTVKVANGGKLIFGYNFKYMVMIRDDQEDKQKTFLLHF